MINLNEYLVKDKNNIPKITNHKLPKGLTMDDVEDIAQEYYNKYMDDPMHEKASTTSTIKLFNKAIFESNKANMDRVLEVISILADNSHFRTMDIMGLCYYIIDKNDDLMEILYK